MPTDKDRRSSSDRRNRSSRRRHAENRSLSIELCHSVLRVALVVDEENDEPPQLTTRTVRWRDEASNLRCEQGKAELTAALKSIVSKDRLSGCRVSFAISSTLCVNRATSGATTRVEEEIASFEERSQLYLSLGPGAKTTAVGRKAIDARHEHALVTVANEETLHLLVQAAESAGLIVDVVESALIALSRLHHQLQPDGSPVILAQLDEDRFEIGVSRSGQLLLEYRPSAESNTSSLGKVVDSHHTRLQRYCQRQYGLGNMNLDQMWLVGEPSEVSQTNAKTKTSLTTGVLPMEQVDKIWHRETEDLPTAEMGAALGLALRGRFDGDSVSPNLMDDIHANAKTPIKPFLLRASVPLAATLLIAASLWAFNLEQEIELSALRQELSELRPLELRGQQLSQRLHQAGIKIEHLTNLVDQAPHLRLDPLVTRFAQCLPSDVWLQQLRLNSESSIELSGISYTEGGVYDFVHHLEKVPGFTKIALRGTGVTETPQGPATSFDIHLDLSPALQAAVAKKERHHE